MEKNFNNFGKDDLPGEKKLINHIVNKNTIRDDRFDRIIGEEISKGGQEGFSIKLKEQIENMHDEIFDRVVRLKEINNSKNLSEIEVQEIMKPFYDERSKVDKTNKIREEFFNDNGAPSMN
jgi:hypothetical protein